MMKKICGLVKFKNENHWRKFVATVCIAFAVFDVGWYYGLQGPALPDLQRISHTDLQGISLLLTIQGVGRVVGGVTLGYLYDRTQRYILLMMTLAFVGATATAALPWAQHYPLFITVASIAGFCFGGINCGSNAKISSMWAMAGRQYMQFVHFSYAVGGIISPLVASPFLVDFSNKTEAFNITDNDTTTTDVPDWFLVSTVNHTNGSHSNNTETPGLSNIFIPFAVSGGLFVLASFALCCFLCIYNESSTMTPVTGDNKNLNIRRDNVGKLQPSQKIILLILLFLVVLSYAPKEFAQQSYLMTFALRQMQWSKPLGALLTSVLWAAFGLGRLLGIFIARWLNPRTMIYGSLTGMVVSFGGQFAGGYLKLDILIWTFVPLSGLAMSVFSPSIVIWINENLMPVSGKMASFIGLTNSLGILISPLYIGFLIDTYTPMWYVYLQGIESAITFGFFTLLMITIDCMAGRSKDSERVPILKETERMN